MKRIIAITLASIVLLNTMGCYLIFLGFHYHNDLAMSKALDSEIYDQSNTISIKVPVSIPYMPYQSGFQKVSGQFKHNGELYRMVKQRYDNDTLIVVCLRDTNHKKIDLALAEHVRTYSDNATDSKPPSKATIGFIKDYLPISFSINSANEGWVMRVIHNLHYRNLIPTFSSSIIHPPERA